MYLAMPQFSRNTGGQQWIQCVSGLVYLHNRQERMKMVHAHGKYVYLKTAHKRGENK